MLVMVCIFTAHGTINIKNKKWEADFSPIDEMGHTYVDTYYTKAYLRHLFAANEFLGKQIATIHNLGFYLWLVREARKHILAGVLENGKKKWCVKWIIDCNSLLEIISVIKK